MSRMGIDSPVGNRRGREKRERGGGGKRGKIKGGHAGFSHEKHVRVTCVKYRYTHVGEIYRWVGGGGG